jgi:glucose/arabinose dehydrogenase
MRHAAIVLGCILLLSGCHEAPSEREVVGPSPTLPQPYDGWLPTLNFSTARLWPANANPNAPTGFKVARYASGLDHPRWLYVLPNGDVLVAESSTAPRAPKSVQERIQFWLQERAGVINPSANRITLLRDAEGDGMVNYRSTFLTSLHQPFGMALAGNVLYVANTDGVWQYPYHDGDTKIESKGQKLLDLPAGGYNNHWTRNIVVNREGTKLYITVGSGSNVGENGMENEFHRADILEMNLDGSSLRVFASGMRNPNGMGWAPGTNTLWTVVNERDMLGNDLVPDYLSSVKEGAFYGWPYSYWGQHVDSRVSLQRPDLVAKAIAPDYALGGHVAALGLTFYSGEQFPEHYRSGAFIGEHGSWNRRPFSGYKVVFVPFRNGHPAGSPEDFLTGFMPADKPGVTYGRPVGVAVDRTGALLVADDVGNMVWRVAANQREIPE